MHLQLGEISAIVISSPQLAKEVMKTNDPAFASRPSILATEIVGYNNSDIAFAPYGDYWRQMRKICTLELLSAKKVRSFCSVREDEVRTLIESIRSSSSSGSPINLTEKIFSSSNAAICKSAFGARCKDQDSMIKNVRELLSATGGFNVADFFPSFKLLHVICGMRPMLEKLHKKVDQIFDSIIKERLQNSEKGNNTGVKGEECLLDVLIRLNEDGGLEFPITPNNVKAVILDMFAAGTDTSSATIEWAMSEMIRNPRAMEKAQAELRQALKGKEVIHESDIQGLGYLKLVIKETLRLHPPAPLVLRECREECEIDGYIIPINTKVIVNAWAIGRDLEYWKDAESFYPERFEDSEVDVLGNNYEYIPFGAGRRMCPGITFALASVELPLAHLLYHFNWKLPNGMKPGDLDMSETFGIAAERRNNLYLIATHHT
ncbi:hypothetical protein LguiB_034271 [Lonicera macranthoides]